MPTAADPGMRALTSTSARLSIRRTASAPIPLSRPIALRRLVAAAPREPTIEQSPSQVMALRAQLRDRADDESEELHTVEVMRHPFESIPVDVDLGELETLPRIPLQASWESTKTSTTLLLKRPTTAPERWIASQTRLRLSPTTQVWRAPETPSAPRPPARAPRLVAVALGFALVAGLGFLTRHAARAEPPATPLVQPAKMPAEGPSLAPPIVDVAPPHRLASTAAPTATVAERRAPRMPRRLDLTTGPTRIPQHLDDEYGF